MAKQENIKIQDTAFLTCTLRSYDEELSKDPYAKLWVDEKQHIWIKKYLKALSYEEVWTHCFRNRFFLETVEELAKAGKVDTMINFGCGFSMYPFLLPNELTYIEIDSPQLIGFKKQNVEKWQKKGVLPQRKNIHFIGVDFSEDYQDALREKILSIKGNRSSFILIEGVLFFLTREITEGLFAFFDSVQQPGDFIGSVSFQDTLVDEPGYNNLVNFLKSVVPKTSKDNYLALEDDFYKTRPNYSLIDHQDYFSLSKKHNHTIQSKPEDILNENFYVLEKHH